MNSEFDLPELLAELESSVRRRQIMDFLMEQEAPCSSRFLSDSLSLPKSVVCRALKDLEKYKGVECKTRERKRSRLYTITKLGKDVIALLEKR